MALTVDTLFSWFPKSYTNIRECVCFYQPHLPLGPCCYLWELTGTCLGNAKSMSTHSVPSAVGSEFVTSTTSKLAWYTTLKNVTPGILCGHWRCLFTQLGITGELTNNMANIGQWETGDRKELHRNAFLLPMNDFKAWLLCTAIWRSSAWLVDRACNLCGFLWSMWSSKHSNISWYCLPLFLASPWLSLILAALVLYLPNEASSF